MIPEFKKTNFFAYLYWLLLLIFLLGLTACGGGGSSAGAGGSGTNGGGGTTGGGGGGTGGGGTGGGGTNSGPFTAGRTKYVRTDATTEYYQWINSRWILFNPITSHFYVTDPFSNRIFVLDSTTQKEIGSINVPEAFGMDDTPDHKTLYVATLIGDVYAVDPVAMTVTNRYQATQIGPYGFQASNVVVMADGRLALLGGLGGIPSVDGSPSFAIWNITDNSIQIYATVYGSQLISSTGDPYTIVCSDNMGNIAGFNRTLDRTKIIVSSIDSDGTLCEVDEASGQSIYTSTSSAYSMNRLLTSPDGNYIILPEYQSKIAAFYDAASLQKTATISVSGDVSSASGFAISADSKTLFVPDSWGIYAYDIAGHQQVGWLANIDVPVTSSGGAAGPVTGPDLQATDGSGLFAGPMEEGVGFIDTTTMQTGQSGSEFPNGYATPATGPASGGTPIQITEPAPFGTLSGIYVGGKGATDISGVSGPDTYGQFGSVSGTTPAGAAGPADIYVFTTDGGMQLIPEGFSYGPAIIEVTPNMSTSEGGGSGVIYGYGFGPPGSGTDGPIPQAQRQTHGKMSSVPSSLQVMVGGKAAQITGFTPYAYPTQSPPFPLQAVAYTIPPGSGSADISVTSSSGSTSAKAMTYLPAIQQFPLSGASLAQGIYDPHNDLYYFSDVNQIRIFSKAQGSWQSPISIPDPPGMTQRLWGLGLSPDGTKMAIADLSAQAIYVLDPANPTSVQTFHVPTYPSGNGAITNACAVAVSDTGIVYYAAYVQGGTGYTQFFKLDSSTGIVTPYPNDHTGEPGLPSTDIYLRTLITSDNSTAYFNGDGAVFMIDTATDNIVDAAVDPGCCYGDYELTLSGNEAQVSATSYLYNSSLEAQSAFALNDREALDTLYIYGAKLSADGTLLFQPSTNGIDVLDGRLGNLLDRIALPVALSENYDALVADGKDNVLIAITGVGGNGIAVVDLSSIREPPPLPYDVRRSDGARAMKSGRNGAGGHWNQKRTHRTLSHGIPHVTNPPSAVVH